MVRDCDGQSVEVSRHEALVPGQTGSVAVALPDIDQVGPTLPGLVLVWKKHPCVYGRGTWSAVRLPRTQPRPSPRTEPERGRLRRLLRR